MTEAAWSGGLQLQSRALATLNAAARAWFAVAVTGQWLFAYYIAAFYGATAARGDLAAWNKVMPHGIVAGDTPGNLAVAAHLALAVVILVGGPLQLVPQLRARAPSFHRWTGRVYLLSALAASVSGLFMAWTRGTAGGPVMRLSVTINAVLIIAFAALAGWSAVHRRLDVHRRWALRLFLVVSGVWFFRVGLMFWIAINQGPVGFDPKTFRGPFLVFLGFAQYLLPLAILEIYLRARDRGDARGRFATAALLFALTVAMTLGIVVSAKVLWYPHL